MVKTNTSGESRHPNQNGCRLFNYIPKDACPSVARALTSILLAIATKPDDAAAWHQLLWFAVNILYYPTGRKLNLAEVVKNRIERQEFLQRSGPGIKSTREGKSPSEVVMDVPTIRDITRRIYNSQEYLVPATSENWRLMEEKHPVDPRADELLGLPDPSAAEYLQVTENGVVAAIHSFPFNSAGGPDGFRPRYLRNILDCRESSSEFLRGLTGFVNVLLRGQCPPEVRTLLFGGTLIALSKKSGGLRPIAIGYVWRRLAAKCANKYAIKKLAAFFNPLQVGIATAGGGEGAVHAVRRYVAGMPQKHIFVKLDFYNAFNTPYRHEMLRAVHGVIPELYAFAHQAYSAETLLEFGAFAVWSQRGPQQGDPIGSLLFCLLLQPVLASMGSEFRLGYLDDIFLGGSVEELQRDLAIIVDRGRGLGLRLNREKCEYYSAEVWVVDSFRDFQRTDRGSLLVLGAPIFGGGALDAALLRHSDALARAGTMIPGLPVQKALLLLQRLSGAAKFMYLLRSAPCWGHPLLAQFDLQLRGLLEQILNAKLDAIQWMQASLPTRDGGLGVRRASMLASSAYLASAASANPFVAAIVRHNRADDFEAQVLRARASSRPEGAVRQNAWDRALIAQVKSELRAAGLGR